MISRLRRPVFVVLVACSVATISSGSAFAAPGALDPTFGNDGRVTTKFPLSFAKANAVAIQADGKILAAGQASRHSGNSKFALARYGTNGRLDPTFGGDGRVTTDFTRRVDLAHAVAIQPDGKIVAAGSAGGSAGFALARYMPDGSLDGTFGGDGKVVTNFAVGSDVAYGVAVQADGKIVAAGSAHQGHPEHSTFALARYHGDGRLDHTFGGDGKVTTNFTPQIDIASAVAIQPNGKIIAAGEAGKGASGSFALARYGPRGGLDPAFGGDGKVTTKITAGDDFAGGVAIQADGKIVAGGTGGYVKFVLVRYDLHGRLDPTFGGDGKVFTDFTNRDDIAYGVAIQAGGKIVAAGSAREGFGDSRFALARYKSNGRLDPTFSGDGRVTTNFTAGADFAHSVAIQANGKIVAAGEAERSAGAFALARYLTR